MIERSLSLDFVFRHFRLFSFSSICLQRMVFSMRQHHPLERICQFHIFVQCKDNSNYFLLPTNSYVLTPCSMFIIMIMRVNMYIYMVQKWYEILIEFPAHMMRLNTRTYTVRTTYIIIVIRVCTKWYYEFIITETFTGFSYIFRVECAPHPNDEIYLLTF